MIGLTLKEKFHEYKFIYSSKEDCLFDAKHDKHFKECLHMYYGMNLPKQNMSGKTKALCDKNVGNWFSKASEQHSEFYQVAHYCVHSFGKVGFVYDAELLLKGISKLTFIKEKPATPWTDGYHDIFYSVDKKRMKRWFKRNHNRLLCSENKVDHKIQDILY